MKKEKFFKPTKFYREYVILDMIKKNPNITQRDISQSLGVSVSMVNDYLNIYEENNLINIVKHSTKTLEYYVTQKGFERIKVLNIGYLNASQILYNSAKENIERFLIQVENRGFKNILLYGAGEVCEILLYAINNSKFITINAKAIIDDNFSKVGSKIGSTEIISSASIGNFNHDGILISSYTNNDTIYKKLINIGYSNKKIIQFFSV
jgi:DNA-binding MarR family transcriptional regulator